ncbi:hypothetical protein D3C71_2233790 [compost metagenome]
MQFSRRNTTIEEHARLQPLTRNLLLERIFIGAITDNHQIDVVLKFFRRINETLNPSIV